MHIRQGRIGAAIRCSAAVWGAGIAFLCLGKPALAAVERSCAQAMVSIHYHPDIAASSILAVVMNEWQALDRQTVASGHAAIAARMVETPAVMNALTQQCNDNPGQSIQAAAAAVYRLARQSLDGY